MKKKEKTVCQIIRFRGNIDTFLVSIEKFARFNNNWIIYLIFYYMILDIEFETPCGSIIKVDLRVKNDGAKVTIQDAEIVSVGKINLIF